MANGFFCGFFFPHPGFPPLWTVGRTLILCSGATGAQLGALARISRGYYHFQSQPCLFNCILKPLGNNLP